MPKDQIKASLNELKNRAPHLLGQMGQEYIGTSPDMPLKKMAELAAGSKTMQGLFQPILDEAKLAYPLLKAVVEANPKRLIEWVKKDPQLLFKRGQIKDPAGRVFYNVSAYQMMKYLCDGDMVAQVMPYVPENITNEHDVRIDLKAIQIEQDRPLQRGGADLIKLNFDPTKYPFLQSPEIVRINNNQSHQDIISLIENPDAILYYKDISGKARWYYVNRETLTVEAIQPQPKTKEEAQQFANLKKSIEAMENNSARRSSDAEHIIIKKCMQKNLVRNGIQYEKEGQCFCDVHHDFNRFYNAYRKCIKLYNHRKWDEGDKVWREELGQAQKEVLWLLQKYCEKTGSPKRGFEAEIWRGSRFVLETIYKEGGFVSGFGSDFAIYNTGSYRGGRGEGWVGALVTTGAREGAVRGNFTLVNQLVENAKAIIIKFKPTETLSQEIRPR